MENSEKFVEYILENIQRDLELLLQYEVLTTTDYDKITSLLNNQQQQPKQGQGLTESLTNSIGNSLIENRLKSFTTNNNSSNNQTKTQSQTNLTKELTGLTKKLSSWDKTQLNSTKTPEGESKTNPNTRQPATELGMKLDETAKNQLPGLKNIVKGAAIKHGMQQWDSNNKNSESPPPLPPKKPTGQPDLPNRPNLTTTNSLHQPDLPKKPTTPTLHPSIPKKPSLPNATTTTTPSLLRNKFQTMVNSFEPSGQDPTPPTTNFARNKFATTSVRLPDSAPSASPVLPVKPRRSATSRLLSKWVQLSLFVSLCQIFFICTLEAIVFWGVLSDRQRILDLIRSLPTLSQDPTPNPSLQFPYLDKVHRSQANHDALLVYFSLFFFAQFFQFVLCCDAARTQNTIQILVLAGFNFLLLMYACVQLNQNSKANQFFTQVADYYHLDFDLSRDGVPLEIAIIVILIIFAISFAVIAYKLYQEYGWNIYKRIGADLQMRRRFTIYHVFVMVMKFDILLFISFSTQYICLVIYPDVGFGSNFITHLTVSIFICLILAGLAFWSVRTENSSGMICFGLGCFGVLCYFGYKLVIINLPCEPPACPRDRFGSSRYFLTVFTCLCILFSIATIAGSWLCHQNFGKGLKKLINDDHHTRTISEDRAKLRTNRWSID